MVRLRDLHLARHLGDPAMKAGFVTPMFDLIAPRYDDFTRLFSFGMDRRWKVALVQGALRRAPAATCGLDLGCGTGDLALATLRAAPTVQMTGIDASREMLACAAARSRSAGVDVARRAAFLPGDLARLPFADASVDLVLAGYAFRNGPPLDESLGAAARVLRPGGVMAVLDFYRPTFAPWRRLFLGYLRAAGNVLGWLWHREPVAYGYIASSIDAYVSADEFSAALARAGFADVSCAPRLGGGVALHLARKR